jgi:D-alanyl-D-alanine carboxypeptidase
VYELRAMPRAPFALVFLACAGCAAAPEPPPAKAEPPAAPPAPVAVAAATAGSTITVTDAPDAMADPDPPAPSAPPPAPTSSSACNEQPPQDFLVRSNYLPKGDAAEIKRRVAMHQEAIRYRTEHYGYFHGFGKPADNPHPPDYYAEDTTFMGKPVRMNKRIIPALKCVEEEIKLSCADHPYTPRALAGIRFHNTYHSGEITNHAYGIAIDIDPAQNSCCGCVPPWNSSPLCKRPLKTGYERMSMPECWVHAFERYGFYWLGHDVLQDTMHFEFLGDPDKIVRAKE